MPGKKSPKRSKAKKAVTEKSAKPKKVAGKGLVVAHNHQPFRDSRLNLALKVAHVGAWNFNLQAEIIEWSETMHPLFGIPEGTFDGKIDTVLNRIHPDDRAFVLDQVQLSITNKSDCNFEYRIVWPDGSIHWVESIGKIILDNRGNPAHLTGTVQDISKKKQLELEREDWKTKNELISRSAGLVIYDYRIQGGDIDWSGNCEQVLGYRSHELGNIDRWVSLIHPDDREQASALLEVAEKELKPYDVIYRFRKKNDSYCYMHDRGFFLTDIHAKAYRMLGMMNDISDRIAAENTIRENIHLRESIENAMPDILFIHDLQNKRNIYTNKNLQRLLGFTLPELRAMGDTFVQQIIHPDDLVNIPKWTKEPQGFVKEFEFRIRQKSGTYIWLHLRDTPLKWDDDGNVTHVIGVAQDITARREFIEKLHRSEESYRELFDTVSEAIYIQEEDGTFVDVNKSACVMFGFEKDEMIGKTPEFFAAENKNDPEVSKRLMEKAFQGEPQELEFWGTKKNGEVFIQEIRLTKGSYFDKPIIIATGRDITQRRNTERALRDSELRFRTLQQASFGGIGLHDRGTIIDCNQGLCDITGYTYQELIGFNGILLIAPEWRDFVVDKIQSSYDKPYDVEGIRKDGTRYMLEIQGKDIPYAGGVIRVTEFRDITERKRTEEKVLQQNSRLQALTEDLQNKNSQLEEFTQIVSHNLRSPVGNIVTLLNFLEESMSQEERSQYVTLLKESSATTLLMLNDLNEVLKIKQNKNIERQNLFFETVLLKIKAMLNARITQAQADVSYDFSEAPTIHFPLIYLESILLNLLDNALKYASPERTPVIRFKSYRNRIGDVIMEIKDNGLGLNLEKYGHQIFKLRKTFHRHPESRGIGLFMIKNQIEALGGKITMHSKENEGSTFFITFSKTQHDAA